jgi:hypothetical protein
MDEVWAENITAAAMRSTTSAVHLPHQLRNGPRRQARPRRLHVGLDRRSRGAARLWLETFQTFLPLFEQVPYRHVATALPDPNRDKELIHYAGFLGVMDTGQALTRFFQRNSEKAGELTLYPHKEDEFWLWVSSWAVFLQKPSDLGFSDDGYDKPPLTSAGTRSRPRSATPAREQRPGRLMRDAAIGVVDAAREKRAHAAGAGRQAAEIVAARPTITSCCGTTSRMSGARSARRARTPPRSTGRSRWRRTRRSPTPSRAARSPAGRQAVDARGRAATSSHCHRAIFAGVGFKFHDWLQAIHRIWRFLQAHEVRIDLIYAETETEVRRNLEASGSAHSRRWRA